MDIKQLETDKELKTDGIWVPYDDARFLIRSTDCPQYRKAIAKASRNGRGRAIQRDPELATALAKRTMAEAIIIDWEGIEEDGTPLPCTLENRLKLMDIEELREFIAVESQDAANFRREGVAADAADLKSKD